MKTVLYVQIDKCDHVYTYVLTKVMDLPVINVGYCIDNGYIVESKIKTNNCTAPAQELLITISEALIPFNETPEETKNRFVDYLGYEVYHEYNK